MKPTTLIFCFILFIGSYTSKNEKSKINLIIQNEAGILERCAALEPQQYLIETASTSAGKS